MGQLAQLWSILLRFPSAIEAAAVVIASAVQREMNWPVLMSAIIHAFARR
jgi:hypothetical protein